jgi:hypothetical protein
MAGQRGRSKRSAKNRLKSGRVTVPVSVASIDLPEGCKVERTSLEVLTHGASSLEQLCALKDIGALPSPRCDRNLLIRMLYTSFRVA